MCVYNDHTVSYLHVVFDLSSQAGLRRDVGKWGIAEVSIMRDEIEAGQSEGSRRCGGAACDEKCAQIDARRGKNKRRKNTTEKQHLQNGKRNCTDNKWWVKKSPDESKKDDR